jgi:5-methylcytosine-specific restriction endonuclease McrA
MGRLKAPPKRLGMAPPRLGYQDRGEAERARDRARAAGDNLRGLYATARWRHPKTGVRVRIIARDGGACAMCHCLLIGRHPAANSPVVDHIRPHRGDLSLFWDEANLQALCKRCHDTEKQSQERSGGRPARGGGFNL